MLDINQNHRVEVGIAEFKIGVIPDVLTTISLGSCVGVALYDPVTKIGGLAHIMLPDSSITKNLTNPAKFADLAIRDMLLAMQARGAKQNRMVAKLVGGAMMFESAVIDPSMQIGERNVKATKTILEQCGIRIMAEDTGKNYGRTMEFYTDTGKVTVRSVQIGTFTL